MNIMKKLCGCNRATSLSVLGWEKKYNIIKKIEVFPFEIGEKMELN